MNRRFFALSLCACLLLAGCGTPGAAAGSAPESAPPQQEETLSTPYAVDFRLTITQPVSTFPPACMIWKQFSGVVQ